MLILTREIGEIIMIRDNIQIKVAKIDRGRVYLSITAPREIDIDRKEIHDRKEMHKDKPSKRTESNAK